MMFIIFQKCYDKLAKCNSWVNLKNSLSPTIEDDISIFENFMSLFRSLKSEEAHHAILKIFKAIRNLNFSIDKLWNNHTLDLFVQGFLQPATSVAPTIGKILLVNLTLGILGPSFTPNAYSLFCFLMTLVFIYLVAYSPFYTIFLLILTLIIIFFTYSLACLINHYFTPGVLHIIMRVFVLVSLSFIITRTTIMAVALPIAIIESFCRIITTKIYSSFHFDAVVWMKVRLPLLLLAMKIVGMASYMQRCQRYERTATFIGYLTHPASILIGVYPLYEEYISANVPLIKRDYKWLCRIAYTIFRAYVFLFVANYILLFIIPSDSHRVMILIREAYRYRFYYYFVMSISEAASLASAMKKAMPDPDDGEFYVAFSCFKTETSSSLFSAALAFNSNTVQFVVMEVTSHLLIFHRVGYAGYAVKLITFLKFLLLGVILGKTNGFILVTSAMIMMYMQMMLCSTVRRFTGERCSSGCCPPSWLRRPATPITPMSKALHFFLTICNVIYINFLSIQFDQWHNLYYANFIIFFIQAAAVILIRLSFTLPAIVTESDDESDDDDYSDEEGDDFGDDESDETETRESLDNNFRDEQLRRRLSNENNRFVLDRRPVH